MVIDGIFIPYDNSLKVGIIHVEHDPSIFLPSVRELIDCELLEFISLTSMLGHEKCLIIDDSGKLKDDLESTINTRATLYFQLLTGSLDVIAGNAIIFGRSDPDLISVPDINYYVDLFNSRCFR